MNRRWTTGVVTCALLGVLCFAGAAWGQSGESTAVSMTTVVVKPGSVGTFEDVIKNQLVIGAKKAKQYFNAWQGATFASPFQYVFVGEVESMARFDGEPPWAEALGPAAATSVRMRIADAMESMQTSAMRGRPELSYLNEEKISPLVIAVNAEAAPGATREIEGLITSEILPMHKKVGSLGFLSYQITLGGSPRGWLFAVPLPNFAELDKGPVMQRALGVERGGKARAEDRPAVHGGEVRGFPLLGRT